MAPEWTFLQALQKYLDHYQTSFGIDAELNLPEHPDMVHINPEVGVQVMRVIQEAMTNANRHGGAHHVKVAFRHGDGRIKISISDDGSGFNPSNVNTDSGKHYGLTFMHERMTQVGGSVKIESQQGAGTTVLLELPVGT
jgi:two-component system NarL family sensor kinase